MADLIETGFETISPYLSVEECSFYEAKVSELITNKAGTRNLLDLTWCMELAQRIQDGLDGNNIWPKNSTPVQCTYFEKSPDQNWLVPMHQDLSIPVAEKILHPDLRGWAQKEGKFFVQPPDCVLNELVAARVHIDDCGFDDGPLRIVAGSHRFGRMTNKKAATLRVRIGETVCPVLKGGMLLMKPLVLHASSKSTGSSKRRILHFIFGPSELPYGLKWKL